MKVGNQYIIPFKGLKQGIHYFEFAFEKEFFDENVELEIIDGLLQSNIELDKKSSFIVLKTELKGSVVIQCDRCLEYFNYEIESNDELFVKFKEDITEPDDKVIFLHPNDDTINLNQYFFDLIGLNIPIQKFHPQNELGEPACSPEMIKIIDAHSTKGENKNDTGTDPRWSVLKDLLKDDIKNN